MQSLFSEFWIFIALAIIAFIAVKSAKKDSSDSGEKREKKFTPSTKEMNLDETEEAIKALLRADYKAQGYIIINDSKNNNFLQFAREKCGLLLNCPDCDCYEWRFDIVKFVLGELGFSEIKAQEVTKEVIDNLRYKEYEHDSYGIYANVGDDSKEAREIIVKIFEGVFGYRDFDHLNVELVLENR